MIIRIKNLRLRTINGINDWERKEKQDFVINAEITYDGGRAVATDDVAHALNYRTVTKRIVQVVEESRFYLLEKLADAVLQTIMEDPAARRARVEVDKLHALRFADSVSVECETTREP